MGGIIGSKTPVHPSDHVNKNQSSDKIFSIVMHIAAVVQLNDNLYPALKDLQDVLEKKREDFSLMSKFGQTHSQDTVSKTLTQGFSEYVHQLLMNVERLKACEIRLYELAIEDKGVGRGSNTPEGFGKDVAMNLSKLTGCQFIDVSHKFQELNTYNTMIELSSTLNTLAVSLMEIVNDIRLLYCKSRCDIDELILSENKPSSSIISDQDNSNDYEAMTMVAAQVMSNHVSLTVGVSMGYIQLNILKPLIIKNILYSIRIITDVCQSFGEFVNIQLPIHTPTTVTHKLPINKSIFNPTNDIEDNSEQENNLSSTIRDQPLYPYAFSSNRESPLIGMMNLINNILTSTSSQTIRQQQQKITRGTNDKMTSCGMKNLSTSLILIVIKLNTFY